MKKNVGEEKIGEVLATATGKKNQKTLPNPQTIKKSYGNLLFCKLVFKKSLKGGALYLWLMDY